MVVATAPRLGTASVICGKAEVRLECGKSGICGGTGSSRRRRSAPIAGRGWSCGGRQRRLGDLKLDTAGLAGRLGSPVGDTQAATHAS